MSNLLGKNKGCVSTPAPAHSHTCTHTCQAAHVHGCLTAHGPSGLGSECVFLCHGLRQQVEFMPSAGKCPQFHGACPSGSRGPFCFRGCSLYLLSPEGEGGWQRESVGTSQAVGVWLWAGHSMDRPLWGDRCPQWPQEYSVSWGLKASDVW